MRRAYLDRARYLGDADFVKVPISRLISIEYAKKLAVTIDPAKVSSSVELGKDIITVPSSAESDETTHFSVIDKNGMAVTNTFTLEGGYGSMVEGDANPIYIDPASSMAYGVNDRRSPDGKAAK